MRIPAILTAAYLALAGILMATPATADTIRLAVTDIEGLEELQRDFGPFRDTLQEVTGLEIELFPVNSRNIAAEALRAERVDFVLTGPAEYVVMRKLTEASPIVAFSRPDYFSAIVVLADSAYIQAEDLVGEKVAMSDVGSTSGHLGPSQLLADYNIDPSRDIEIVHTSREVAHEALKRGDVAAIGVNYRSWVSRVRDTDTQLPPGAFRTMLRGGDLPNDVLVVGPHVDAGKIETMRAAFTEHSDALIEAIVSSPENGKYVGMQFLPNVQDSDYNGVRLMYATIGFPEYSEFVGD